jgi:short-subunit dehydrogenase
MGWVDQRTGRNPAVKSELTLSLPPLPSLSEALSPFSAVLLTGGSSGIGKSFIELGSKLHPGLRFCNLSRRAPPENIFPNATKRLNHIPCDLTRPEEVARAMRDVEGHLAREVPAGKILLINNSGLGAFGHFPEPGLARQLEMIEVNVRAVVQLTGLFLPTLRARGGAIMNIASTMSFMPTPYAATYGATKAFVLHWTLALNEELRGTGVRALAVCPGTTSTPFFRTAGLGDGGVAPSLAMTTDEVVMAAFRALAAGRRQVVTGWKNKLYTSASALLPKPIIAQISAKILGRFRLNAAART